MSGTHILIPNQNGLRWLPDCLGTLKKSIAGLDARVLIVDNASTDGSQDYVLHHFPEFDLTPLRRNLGFVHAMNVAILEARRAGAERVVLLNNDTRMTRTWLSQLLDVAQRHEHYGILGVLQKDFDDVPSPRTRAIIQKWSRSEDGDADQPSLPELIDADWVEGSCMLIQDWVFDRIGYLDPLFAPAYFEEVDFCRRARAQGIGVGLVSNAMIWHFGTGTSSDKPKRSRQRILSERNYLLYHATAAEAGFARPLRTLVRKALVHGGRQWSHGELSLREWISAVAGLPAKLTALEAKVRRDLQGAPCPILGDRPPRDDDGLYAAQCIQRIQQGASICQRSDINESAPQQSVAGRGAAWFP